MKVLNVLRSAFRTLVEEQDDTILWLTQCLQKAGADLQVLLEGGACQYACLTTAQPALNVGAWRQESPANTAADIERLQQGQVPVFVLAEDLAAHGIDATKVLPGVRVLPREKLAELYENADLVWQW